MTVSFPYSLTAFADTLHLASVIFDAQRNDEMSGTGDGRILLVELAPPLWTAEVEFAFMTNAAARQVAAKIRALQGSLQSFFLYDPAMKYPANDPTGSIIGSSDVRVAGVVNRSVMSLSGLPNGYKLVYGDKFQITNSDSDKFSLHEISENENAASDGTTGNITVFPPLPTWVIPSNQVSLKKPACKFIIMPGTFKAGTSTIEGTTGMGFKAIQRK